MKRNTDDRVYYETTPSQDVVILQCKYTLFKRIVNIVSSMDTKEKIDWDIMEQAMYLTIVRNDCLRLRFVKKGKKLMQYFDKPSPVKIGYKKFYTKQDQEDWINQITKKAIKYKKGVVIEPYFVETYDHKYMVLLKVCHLILDIYGMNVIYNDLFQVYKALKENTALPPAPGKYEDVVKRDLIRKNDSKAFIRHAEFFEKLLKSKPEPSYAGLHGDNSEIWRKLKHKGRRSMKMFFIKCDTKGYVHDIDKETVDKVMNYAQANEMSPTNVLFYAMSLTASLLNGKVNNMIPLELCNCRGTLKEKGCAGTKVQSLGRYTNINYDETFEQNLKRFASTQNELYKHLDFLDSAFEMMLHKIYGSSMMSTYYSLTYSFIPFAKPDNINFQIYSNGKCALPAYVGQLYDINTGEIQVAYDVQTMTHTEADIKKFHTLYVKILNLVMSCPQIVLEKIEVK
ncbi:MAG: hypothetical protein IKC79_01225 [Clostridia bacterium]|nr:hypothetical protein [Clostridia bacterium]